MDEYFYDSLEKMYAEALESVLSLPIQEQKELRERLEKLVTSSSGLGWGYHDGLCALFDKAFSE